MNMGQLYMVATPIGNPEDITLRAIRILGEVDVVICEERREGSTLLKKLGITPKELVSLNEHNEAEQAAALVQRMLLGENMALISDAGTPVFADPGAELIRQAVEMGIKVTSVPGASSLMALLSLLDTRLEQFVYVGFLPRSPQERRQQLQRFLRMNLPLVMMDTPYRLSSLLEDIEKTAGKNRRITLGLNLTQPGEQVLRGTVNEIRRMVQGRKAEFILLLH
ncbi:MAG TPA: 16S rRNA (cytidine(1402)-2'-O)-methyltransferase [Anaerolineaceae bacterium]|nr:16S rRNA (cytidine(1402)-2'-O)-methyltransferase [Anaerolineaceae bacterium]